PPLEALAMQDLQRGPVVPAVRCCCWVQSVVLNSLISADLLWSAFSISEVTAYLLRSAACNSLISDI
ncbi:hypothetical protein Tco_1118415, partial [Tanacetum coccineum]